MSTREPRRDERGAVAVVAAVSMVMLFALGAVAVDLGNAFARKRDLQQQADLAALAGAQSLERTNQKVPGNEAVKAVATYLNENQPQDDDGFSVVTPGDLVDDVDTNGEVYFLGNSRMRVLAPLAQVNFGLADAIGFDNMQVGAEATVQIRSGGGVLPFYAVDGCDYGPQTISDPPPGKATDVAMAFPDDAGTAAVTGIDPDQVDLGQSPSPTLKVTGSKFTTGATVTQVGFFRGDGATYRTQAVSATTPPTDTEVTIDFIPLDVLSTEDIWWVRVLKNGKWSPADEAQPLTVGSAVLECAGSAVDGNFGSLKLPRADVNDATGDGWLPVNIAAGLQEPLTLSPHDLATPPSWTCSDGFAEAVVSTKDNLREGTNCVDTDTGLPATAATAGFVTGGTKAGTGVAFKGRLDVDTTKGCGADPGNRDARWDTGIKISPSKGNYLINDDVLSCFFTDDATTIAHVSQKTFTGAPVIDPKIYYSPRFFYQPVLGIEPTSGGSNRYSIIDFRAGFITDQPLSANRVNLSMGTSTDHNGFTIDSGNITEVKVVFFNIDALPAPPEDAPTTAYMGYGPRAIRLVN